MSRSITEINGREGQFKDIGQKWNWPKSKPIMCSKRKKRCCRCRCRPCPHNTKCKLATMFTMNFCFFLVELIVGYYTKSMALVADSFHMLSDVAALVIAFVAVKMSSKKWKKNTYGWARAEVLGALVNAVFLIALCFSIIVDSIQRFINPEDINDPRLLLIVGCIGLLMNVAGLCIFHDHGHSHGGGGHSHGHGHSHGARLERRRSTMVHSNRLTRMVSNVETDMESEAVSISIRCDEVECEDDKPSVPPQKQQPPTEKTPVDLDGTTQGELDETTVPDSEAVKRSSIHFNEKDKVKLKSAEQMNVQGVFMHLLADTLGSVVVVISALVYILSDWEYRAYIDPSMSMFSVIIILISVYPLLVESSLILLQSVPSHIDLEELERKLLRQIDGVVGVHELHVWRLAGDRIIATAHIKCQNLSEYYYIAQKVKAVFHNEGIHSTTIQPEFIQHSPELQQIAGNQECFLSCSVISTTTNCSASLCCPPPALDIPTPSEIKPKEQASKTTSA